MMDQRVTILEQLGERSLYAERRHSRDKKTGNKQIGALTGTTRGPWRRRILGRRQEWRLRRHSNNGRGGR